MGEAPRIVCWFSHGAPSAVAAKMTIARKLNAEVVVASTSIPSEHPDNARFGSEVSEWLGRPIVYVSSDRYADTWDVWEQRRWISGPRGALCTTELKKMVRHKFQRVDDVQVFGYTVEERKRVEWFRANNPEVNLAVPLIDAGLTKADCKAIVQRAGIRLPVMYDLGFRNNNCIPCAKATSPSYWNRIRLHFPDRFDRMARLSRELDVRMVQVAGERLFLDELESSPPSDDEPDIECSLLCAIAETEMADA